MGMKQRIKTDVLGMPVFVELGLGTLPSDDSSLSIGFKYRVSQKWLTVFKIEQQENGRKF